MAARSAAERKRDQRERDIARGLALVSVYIPADLCGWLARTAAARDQSQAARLEHILRQHQQSGT